MAMVRINLAPFEETENHLWWVVDAVAVVLIFAITLSGVNSHFAVIEDEIDHYNQEASRYQEKNRSLQSDVDRVRELEGQKDSLLDMKRSAQNITNSKLTKYLPVILIEHIQNLKPDGVWLTSLVVDAGSEESDDVAQSPEGQTQASRRTLIVSGEALESTILAEFMTQIKATKNQEVDPADLRTRVFFSFIDMKFADLVQNHDNREKKHESPSILKFELVVGYDEREIGKVFNAKIGKAMKSYRKSKG